MARDDGRMYVVRRGDTLSAIALRHDIDWRVLARHNGLANPHRISIGTKLRIPSRSARPQPAPQATRPQPRPAVAEVPRPAPRLPATPARPHRPEQTGERLGSLSMIYETGFSPGREAQAARVVSTGQGDPGGVSYGAYQLTSSAAGGRQVQVFLRNDGSRWAGAFGQTNPERRGGEFGRIWQAVADREPAAFFNAQHAYIERTHYTPVVNYVRENAAFDITARSRAVQNVVWSMSVQHGRAARLVARGVRQLDARRFESDVEYDRALINTLYDIRTEYVRTIGLSGLSGRYTRERRDALRQLGTP